MIRRIHALYLRYLALHGDALRHVSIGPRFKRIGRVEAIERHGQRIHVRGWIDAETVTLSWAGETRTILPDRPRADVAARKRLPLHCGFEVDLPGDARQIAFCAVRADRQLAKVTLPHPYEPLNARDALRAKLSFTRDLIRAVPAILRFYRNPDDRNRKAVKLALRQDISGLGHPIDARWLRAPATQVLGASDAVTIIVPIHNAFSLLRACLARVEAHTDLPWQLIAVDDASTDPGLRPWLLQWAKARPHQVTVLTQDQNRGFIGSVNAALEHAQARGLTGPIVLLNTDAMVPAGWASRLIAPLVEPDIATVTPMSNNAEILSVPAMGTDMPLPNGAVDSVDAIARRLVAPDVWPATPTGVGFCMAMSQTWIAKVPRFDMAFGRGYGEEVDWCQKTRRLGARHVVQPRLFVEHIGGQSFGSVDKLMRVRAAGAELSRRYPRYDAEVQRFMYRDPVATPRLALAVAMAAQLQDPLPVFMAHALGGGAELALMQEVSELQAAVVLRVGGACRFQVEVHMGGRKVMGHCDDLDTLSALLAPVRHRHFIYSCGVGDPDPVSLPRMLLALRQPGDLCSARLHDYFMLSPSYTLLGSDGRFDGVPASDTRDPAHLARRPDGAVVSLAQWRAAWGAFLAEVDAVTVFSESSGALLTEAYPNVPVIVRPHHLSAWIRPVRPGSKPKAIGILGNINRHKGGFVLARLAVSAPEMTFVIIGNVDSTIPLPRNVKVHGAYALEDVCDLAERYGIGTWLMPSIWPETYSFVTHEALATGLPVVGFALGAQGDALDRAALGITVPLTPDGTAAARLLAALDVSYATPRAAE